ncbi:MAG: SNF2-related protein [Betaproteobacteria bacterium]
MHATWVPSGARDAFGGEEGRCGAGSAPRFDGRFFIWGESPERLHAKPRITRPGERRRRYARHSFLATRDELELALATLLEAAAGMCDLPSTRAATMLALLPSRDGRPEPSPLLLREVFVLHGEEGFSRPQNGGFEARGVVASGLPPAEHAARNGREAGAGGKQGGAEETAAGADNAADDAQAQAGVEPSGRRLVGLYRVTGVSLSAADALSLLAVVPEDGDLRPAIDDPSLVVPATRVWREKGRVLEFLGRRFENPQERLLADLGRASRLFPAIEDTLKTARPEACYLTTAEAYSFLREVAPLLEESGFGVLVPPWWDHNRGKAARLGIHLKVRAPASASASPGAGAPGNSYFGMDSLVEYDWQIALGDQVMDKDEFRRLVALKVPLVRVRGEWVEIRPEDVEAAIKFWDRRRKAGVLTVGEALATALQAGSGEESGLPVVRVDADGWIGDLIGRLSAGEKIQELPQPRGFAGSLRPYQVRGYSWLSFLKEWGIGACLADDMGLGKTIQVIALVLRAKEEGALSGPVLLVCPTSVVGNWRREIGRFGPSLKVMVHHGADRLSGHALAAEASTCDVVITTYSLVHRDEKHLARIEWHGIVLDEAQNIKNSGTRQSQSVRRLKAGFRVALTGTPIENRLSELWSIMDFLNPGYLGPAAEFRRRFAIPIERYRDRDRAERLRRLVGPFILRRLKTDPRACVLAIRRDGRHAPGLPSRRARARGGEFGKSWWAKRWISVLESFGWSNRLQRGRSYARYGNVLDVVVAPGEVRAKVQGSRPRPWFTSRDFDERRFAVVLADYYKTVSREALSLAYDGGGNGTGTTACDERDSGDGNADASGYTGEPARGV